MNDNEITNIEPSLEISGGWLAPDGKYYPCKSHHHERFARQLSLKYYGKEGCGRLLENTGWIHIYAQGNYSPCFSEQMTQAQINTLFDLSELIRKNGDKIDRRFSIGFRDCYEMLNS